MLKKFKKFFKKSSVNNERGSVLSIALVVITILTFSLTTITQVTVNLSGATTLELQQVNSDNTAKGLISTAINEFKVYIETTDPGNYTAFNNVEVPRILADYGVTVTDESIALGYGTIGEVESTAYKFSYPLDNGATIYKYCFVSNRGTELIGFEPFDYSIGTNGTLVLNGGRYYSDTVDPLKIYGNKIWMAGEAPYVRDGFTTQSVTPQSSEVFPVLTGANAAEIWATDEYKYCEDNCFTTNGSSLPFELNNLSNYVDVEGSALPDKGNIIFDKIQDFFGTFSFENYFFDFLRDEAPESTATFTDTLTWANVQSTILSYAVPITPTYKKGVLNGYDFDNNSKFIDITGFDPAFIDFEKDYYQGQQRYSMVNVGNLTINGGIKMSNDRTDSLINFGDLTLVGDGSKIDGKIVVFGDLYLTGNTYDFEGVVIVTGETFINFNSGEGITTTGNNAGFTVIGMDNIIVEEIRESHAPTANPTVFSMFLYTEESIYIDAVNSEVLVEGSYFARASGTSGNSIFMNDETGTPINGIVINSYMGYIDNSGVASPLPLEYRYELSKIASNNYLSTFLSIPVFESVVTSTGVYTFETSEFVLE